MKRLVLVLSIALSATAELKLPSDFHLDVFARDLGSPKTIISLEDGTVLVSRPEMNDVIALRDRDGDGRADEVRTAVASVDRAYGLAMRGRVLYVAGVKKIVAAERQPDGSFGEPVEVVGDLPDGGQHPQRAIGVGPDGKLYVAIGSSCGDCAETNPEHATILQLDADGTNRRIYARGLREPLSFAWSENGDLWGGDTGEVNRIGDGLHYGWPLCVGRNALNATSIRPEGITQEKFCKSAEGAAVELGSKLAPVGFVFHDGDAFAVVPDSIARVRFHDGKAVAVESFASGIDGRLAGAAVAKDGALLVTDARNGVIYRIAQGAPGPMISSASEAFVKPVLAKAFNIGNLRGPESVLHDEEQDVYFVSNVDGEPGTKDGKGFISRITPDGKIADLQFISGLNAPKGMAIRGTELWVADIDALRVFNRVTGAAVRTIELAPEGAVFLRDVAVGPDESVYVTDTGVQIKGAREHVRVADGRVFRVSGEDDIEIAAAGEELRAPSGIAWDGTRFLIAQAYGKEVLAWRPGSGAKAVLRGPGAFDGLVVLPNGAVIVASHHDNALHVAHEGGELRPLFARNPSPAGIGFDRKRNRLLIPSVD
ncbi:MAG: PQQ-dependent sugar dehydrogenase, partial [Thermoanaerobaculia bacterium]